MLDRSFRRSVTFISAAVRNRTQDKERRTRYRRSVKVRYSLALQGRYMAYMRQLKPRQKAQVRKIREAKGVRAAIPRARELVIQRNV